jgi:hypothetical protein
MLIQNYVTVVLTSEIIHKLTNWSLKMRLIVSIIAFLLIPIAAIVVAFQVAKVFVEHHM